MNRANFIVATAGFSGMLAAGALAAPSGDEAALRDLLAALGSGDDATLRAAIERRYAANVPVEQRLARLRGLAQDLGPFTLVRMLPAPDGASFAALVRDGHGMLATWTAHCDAQRKITLIQLTPGGPPPPPVGNWRDLHDLIARLRAQDGVPGIAAAAYVAGRWERAADGVRTLRGARIDPGDIFKSGSIGKSFCSSIIARLIERGKLDWETTIGSVLKTPGMNAAYAPVTIDDLLHHRGGIAADTNFSGESVARIAAGATDARTLRERYVTDVLSRDPIGPRGSFEYSNGGYAIAGYIAERITGIPYDELLRSEVFSPLAMTHAYTGSDTLPAHPEGHEPGPGGPRPATGFGEPLEKMLAPAGGGIWLSMHDLVLFGLAHMRGLHGAGGYLKAATVARLHTGTPQPGTPLEYACGWGIVGRGTREEMHGHNGSDGTFLADFGIYPKLGLVVASAMNCGGSPGFSAPERAVREFGKRYASRGSA